MDITTFRRLYMHQGEKMLDREYVRWIIDDTSDATLLRILFDVLVDGSLDYINPELSRIAAEKVLELSKDECVRNAAYRRLMEYDMIKGVDFRPFLRQALEEHIVPWPTFKLSRKDRRMVRDYAMQTDDLDFILCFAVRMNGREAREVIDHKQMEHMVELLDRLDTKARVMMICAISRYYAGPIYDRILSRKLEDSLSVLSRSDFDADWSEDIHGAIERLTDRDEHEWFLRSLSGMEDFELNHFRQCYYVVDEKWKGRYLDVYRGLLSGGMKVLPSRFLHCMPTMHEDILPLELIDHAMGCYQSLIAKGSDYKDRSDYYAMDISVACLYAGRYQEAYEYALKSGLDVMCPIICTCLADGSGVEKDIGLAKELSDKYRSIYKGNDINNSPNGKRDVMDWYRKRISEE